MESSVVILFECVPNWATVSINLLTEFSSQATLFCTFYCKKLVIILPNKFGNFCSGNNLNASLTDLLTVLWSLLTEFSSQAIAWIDSLAFFNTANTGNRIDAMFYFQIWISLSW